MSSCSIFGHRVEHLPWGYDENDERYMRTGVFLCKQLLSSVSKGFKVFYTNCSPGINMLAGELIVNIRDMSNIANIQVIAVIPYAGQEKKQPPTVKRWYDRLVSSCNKVVILQEEYTENCHRESGMYMLERSDHLISAFHIENSVSGEIFNKAVEQGLYVERMNTETILSDNYEVRGS